MASGTATDATPVFSSEAAVTSAAAPGVTNLGFELHPLGNNDNDRRSNAEEKTQGADISSECATEDDAKRTMTEDHYQALSMASSTATAATPAASSEAASTSSAASGVTNLGFELHPIGNKNNDRRSNAKEKMQGAEISSECATEDDAKRTMTEDHYQALSMASSTASAATPADSFEAESTSSASSGVTNMGFELHPIGNNNYEKTQGAEIVSECATEDDARGMREPSTDEKIFMDAIENGEISVFMEMMYRKKEMQLDLDGFRDANGMSPLRLAISKGYSGMVEILLQNGARIGDGLLRAVDVGFLETVKRICDHATTLERSKDRRAILECHCEDDDYHPDVTPMVLAAQENNFTIVKVLSDAGCKIKLPKKKKNVSAAADDLQKSVGSLELYKGLASDAYVTQVNEDPIDTAFKLSNRLRYLGAKDVEFKPNYIELADQVDQLGTELISHARNTTEILSVLTYYEKETSKPGQTDLTNRSPLPKISRAIDFQQKSFVAHPNCQQTVLAKFYGKQAFLRDMSTNFKLIYMLLMILGFPILSLLYLYVPIQKVKQFIGCSYSKFVLKFASDLIFVILLTVDTILTSQLSKEPSYRNPTKAILLIWVVGIAWQEIKAFYRQGAVIFTQSSNLRDILLVILFFLGIAFNAASYILYTSDASDVTSLSKRDVPFQDHPLPGHVDIADKFPIPFGMSINEEKHLENKLPVLKRVARATRARGDTGGSEGESTQVNLTNPVFIEFINYDWWHPRLLSTAMFAMSTVVSFLRLLQYAVVSDVIGPFQISLGIMVARTGNFFLVPGIVLFSFSVGLTYMYSYYDQVKSITCAVDSEVECEDLKFENLMYSNLYLFWSTLGLEDEIPLKLNSQSFVIEVAGDVLYAAFNILMVLVLFNALIAVMSDAFNTVEENADVEWKFYSTVMWMNILLDDDVIPPPFNLLPSTDSIMRFVAMCWRLVCRCQSLNCRKSADDPLEDKRSKKSKRNDTDNKAQYKRVINKLVERYVTEKTKNEVSVNADVNMTDIIGLKNELQSLKLDIFQRLFETNHRINQTAVESHAIRDTSEKAKSVLYKAGEIHGIMDLVLNETVLDFRTSVKTQQEAINKEAEELERRRLEERKRVFSRVFKRFKKPAEPESVLGNQENDKSLDQASSELSDKIEPKENKQKEAANPDAVILSDIENDQTPNKSSSDLPGKNKPEETEQKQRDGAGKLPSLFGSDKEAAIPDDVLSDTENDQSPNKSISDLPGENKPEENEQKQRDGTGKFPSLFGSDKETAEPDNVLSDTENDQSPNKSISDPDDQEENEQKQRDGTGILSRFVSSEKGATKPDPDLADEENDQKPDQSISELSDKNEPEEQKQNQRDDPGKNSSLFGSDKEAAEPNSVLSDTENDKSPYQSVSDLSDKNKPEKNEQKQRDVFWIFERLFSSENEASQPDPDLAGEENDQKPDNSISEPSDKNEPEENKQNYRDSPGFFARFFGSDEPTAEPNFTLTDKTDQENIQNISEQPGKKRGEEYEEANQYLAGMLFDGAFEGI